MHHPQAVTTTELLRFFHVVRDCGMAQTGPPLALVETALRTRRVDPAVDPIVHRLADGRIRRHPAGPLPQQLATAPLMPELRRQQVERGAGERTSRGAP